MKKSVFLLMGVLILMSSMALPQQKVDKDPPKQEQKVVNQDAIDMAEFEKALLQVAEDHQSKPWAEVLKSNPEQTSLALNLVEPARSNLQRLERRAYNYHALHPDGQPIRMVLAVMRQR